MWNSEGSLVALLWQEEMLQVSWLQLQINKFSKQRVSEKRNNLNCSEPEFVEATSAWGNCCRLTYSYALSSSSLEERNCWMTRPRQLHQEITGKGGKHGCTGKFRLLSTLPQSYKTYTKLYLPSWWCSPDFNRAALIIAVLLNNSIQC